MKDALGNRLIKFNFYIILLFVTIVFSCAKDDDVKTEETIITITTEDLIISIDEHPEDNYILGKVESETNIGSLIFNIEEQDPNDALLIDELTGEVRVKNGSLFDYETNPEMTAIVKVTNGDKSENANIIINLKEPQEIDYYKMIDESNLWIDSIYYSGGISDTYIYRKVYLDGEEIINGKQYFNLYSRIIDYTYFGQFKIVNNSVKEAILMYKIREDETAKKVYILDGNNNEVLLYDFSLEVNDIIDLWNPRANSYTTQTVKSVEDIVLLNGDTRKNITFESDYSIIEGLGYNNVRNDFSLSCFFMDSNILYSPNNVCDGSFWDQGNTPSLNIEVSYIVNNEFVFRSNLLADGGNHIENNIIEKGICWSSTSHYPTINDNYNNLHSNVEFEVDNNEVSNLKGFYNSVSNSEFQPNTVYHFRAYSKNANGILYSDTSYSMDSVFLTSDLSTVLLSREIRDGMIRWDIKGSLINNNFPNSVNIVEKGFAVTFREFGEPASQSPSQSIYMPVQNGTLENFEKTISYGVSTDFSKAYFWSYVKFDNGLIVYGKVLISN